MFIKLKLIGGKHTGKEIEVRGERFFIGRGEDCHLRPSSESVSRRHCALVMESNRVRICDFNSSNGTFVNTARVNGEQTLHSGDLVKVGPLEFSVLISSPPKTKSSTESKGQVEKDDFDSADASKQDDFIQQWLTDAPRSASSRDTIDDKLTDTNASAIGHPHSTETTAGDAPDKFATVGISRIPPSELVGRKTTPRKLPKPETVKLPNPADCNSTSEAAKAALTGFLVNRDAPNREG